MSKFDDRKHELPQWLSYKRAIPIDDNELFADLFERKSFDERRTPFQRDIDTITFDSSFRRLAHKTQVALNPRKDFTRTRLTHSLEVSRIGRQISRIIADVVFAESKTDARRCFEDAAGAACLVHDIGHPAFGHKGEKVLSQLLKKKSECIAERSDKLNFEGNKQNFRLLTKGGYKNQGMNLTYAVLDGILKYKKSVDPEKKGGVYEEDAKELEAITAETKCKDWLNPITYIIEAADDIAFCSSDIEDALKEGWIPKDEVINALTGSKIKGFHNGWRRVDPKDWAALVRDCEKKECYEQLKTAIIKGLLIHSLHVFDSLELGPIDPEDLPEYLNSKLQRKPILEHESLIIENSDAVKTLKKRIYKEGFLKNHQIVESESQAASVICKTWDYLEDIYKNPERCIDKLVPNDFARYLKDERDEVKRLRAIADYISGMTDRFALKFIDIVEGRSGAIHHGL